METTPEQIFNLIRLGWRFRPAGENRWEWLKVDSAGRCVARQGGDLWRKIINENEVPG
jgi:hypothetical protein